MNKPQTISSFIINNKDVLCNEFSKETVKNWIYGRSSPNKTAREKILKIAKEQNVELEIKSSDEIKAEFEITLNAQKRIKKKKLDIALNEEIDKLNSAFHKWIFSENKGQKRTKQYKQDIKEVLLINNIMRDYGVSEYCAKQIRSNQSLQDAILTQISVIE